MLELHVLWGLNWAQGLGMVPGIMENQMAKNMENKMESGFINLLYIYIYIHMSYGTLGAP